MIDEKKIEEAAINASIEDTAKGKVREDYVISAMADHELGFQEGFKAGINWFLGNLWHDASEKPEAFRYILAETEEFHKGYKVLMFHGGDPWEKVIKFNNITRWLYIEDLMKGGSRYGRIY